VSWDPSLETGIAFIDSQHRQLVETIEKFYDACKNNHGREVINSTLNFLESYAAKHFADEEEYQKANNYPKGDLHKELHRYFIQDINDLEERIDQEGISSEVIHEISQFLMEWLCGHISSADMEFAAYCAALK